MRYYNICLSDEELNTVLECCFYYYYKLIGDRDKAVGTVESDELKFYSSKMTEISAALLSLTDENYARQVIEDVEKLYYGKEDVDVL